MELSTLLVGVLIGSIPTLVNHLCDMAKQKIGQEHEIRKFGIETFKTEKMKAVKSYWSCYCVAKADISLYQNFVNFSLANNTLDMFVSDETHAVLQEVYSVIEENQKNAPPVPGRLGFFLLCKF